VIGLVVFTAAGAYVLGARVVRYKRGKGAPYRDQEEKDMVRKASLSEILSEVPRSGRKLMVLVALACCCAYLIADGGLTIGATARWIGSYWDTPTADRVEDIYTSHQLWRNVERDEYDHVVQMALTPSERALTAGELMEWIDEFSDDDVYHANCSAESDRTLRQNFLLRVLRERHSFNDTEALADFIPHGTGDVFGRDCDASRMELAFLALRALKAEWPVSERAFRSVFLAATTLECSDWPGSSDNYEDDFREQAMETLQYWHRYYPEDFTRLITRLNLAYQFER
jgi:hypothetical protein